MFNVTNCYHLFALVYIQLVTLMHSLCSDVAYNKLETYDSVRDQAGRHEERQKMYIFKNIRFYFQTQKITISQKKKKVLGP